MLATKSTWEGATKLTLDIRQGVKWSDGKPLTAADVAFTFTSARSTRVPTRPASGTTPSARPRSP